MNNYKLYIEYDGSRYSGWQMQENSKTIQGTILGIAEKIFKGEKVDVQGSGRTDSGVHALMQIAHLEVKKSIEPEILRLKLNDGLPYDINIIKVEKAPHDFHARKSAISRSYIYQISTRRSAFGKQYSWWIKDKLNFAKMESATKLFIGMHDFYSFSDRDKIEKSTKVLVEDLSIIQKDSLLIIQITASHFLWKMVRRIVGTLVEVGRGKLTENDIKKYISTKTNDPANYTAPPSGLFLASVNYSRIEKNKYPQNLINLD